MCASRIGDPGDIQCGGSQAGPGASGCAAAAIAANAVVSAAAAADDMLWGAGSDCDDCGIGRLPSLSGFGGGAGDWPTWGNSDPAALTAAASDVVLGLADLLEQ